MPDAHNPGFANTARRILAIEGPRGIATRSAVVARHAAQLLGVLFASAANQAALSSADASYGAGGTLMLFAATGIWAITAIGTLFAADQREDLLDQARHYVWGIIVLPGTAIALLIWGTTAMQLSADGNGTFERLLGYALPLIWLLTVLFPVAIYAKAIAGMRTLMRTSDDIEEGTATLTRQDSWMSQSGQIR